jgi:hypothetical protein
MGFWFGYEAGAFTGGRQIVRGQFGAAPPGGGEQPVAIDDDALLRPAERCGPRAGSAVWSARFKMSTAGGGCPPGSRPR